MTSSNLWGSKKMADRFEYNINSIDFIDKQDNKIDRKFKLDLIDCYVWALSKYRKVILNLNLKELREFYSYIGGVNKSLLKKYMNRSIYYFYIMPNTIIFVSQVVKPINLTILFLKKIKNNL